MTKRERAVGRQNYVANNLPRTRNSRTTIPQVNLLPNNAMNTSDRKTTEPNEKIINTTSIKGDKEFIKVSYANISKRNKPIKTGTSTENTITNGIVFAGRESKKKAWLFISHVKDTVNESTVKQYIINKTRINESENVIVKEVKVNFERKDCKCFMIGVDFSLKERVYEEDFWPAGVTYRRYNFNFQKITESKNSENFSLPQKE